MNDYNCPTCLNKTELSKKNIFRPFCSKRCQNRDLGSWAEEKFSIVENDLNLPLKNKNIYNDESGD